jgi:hypothetical protein
VEITGLLIAALLVALFAVITVVRAVRIVPQTRACNVERLGRYHRTLTPGLNFVLPYLDRVYPKIDLREQVVSFKPQPVITEDNPRNGTPPREPATHATADAAEAEEAAAEAEKPQQKPRRQQPRRSPMLEPPVQSHGFPVATAPDVTPPAPGCGCAEGGGAGVDRDGRTRHARRSLTTRRRCWRHRLPRLRRRVSFRSR